MSPSRVKSLFSGDWLKTLIVVGIAIVSSLGAYVAYRASVADQDSSRLYQTGLQELSRQQQIKTNYEAEIDQDLRNLGPYQEHLKAADLLTAQADRIRTQQPALADLLLTEAQGELALARVRQALFIRLKPNPGAANQTVSYDRSYALKYALQNDNEYSDLRPDTFLAQAGKIESKATGLTALVMLFVLSLVFLTLANFTRLVIRQVFAVGGGLISLFGLVAFFLVESIGR